MKILKEIKMDKEKYLNLINQSIKEPEKSPSLMKDLLDIIEEDSKEYENLTKIKEDNQKKIRELQDVNMKLFLSQTNKQTEEPEEKEETQEEIIMNFIKELKGE